MPVTVDIIPQATITDVTIWRFLRSKNNIFSIFFHIILRSKPGLSILDKWETAIAMGS